MRKSILYSLMTLSLTSCASHQVAENGCKFVQGAHESQQRRKSAHPQTAEDNETDSDDIINGILALFSISLSDEKEECPS